MAINIIVNGAHGKMGSVTQAAIAEQADLNLVATTGREDDLQTVLQKIKADVMIDFTRPDCVFANATIAINNKTRPVIGTSGLTLEQIDDLTNHCQQQKLGGIIAPNFSLGAILMMKYARDAANYFADVEIIEMHHQQKVDAPSGTAKKTAEMMATVHTASQEKNHDKNKQENSTRGKKYQNIAIHSIRLPGLFAHQAVIFGAAGETLTIRHDSLDRGAMMPGVILACRKVMSLNHLVYGLEHFL